MMQGIEHYEGLFTHAPHTHESRTASSSTNPFQSMPWCSTLTSTTAPQPPIHGEPIVRGVPTGVPEPKFFFEPHAPSGPQVFQGSPSSEESTILLSALQQLKCRLESLQSRTSANSTTKPCVPCHPSPLTRVCGERAGVPPRVRSRLVRRTQATKPVACFTTTYEVYSLDQAFALGLR